jgi:hypothetical protein
MPHFLKLLGVIVALSQVLFSSIKLEGSIPNLIAGAVCGGLLIVLLLAADGKQGVYLNRLAGAVITSFIVYNSLRLAGGLTPWTARFKQLLILGFIIEVVAAILAITQAVTNRRKTTREKVLAVVGSIIIPLVFYIGIQVILDPVGFGNMVITWLEKVTHWLTPPDTDAAPGFRPPDVSSPGRP